MLRSQTCGLRNLEYDTRMLRTVEVRGQGWHRIEVEEDGAGTSALMVEEDCVGFSTIEVGDKHVGPSGLGDLEVPEYHML